MRKIRIIGIGAGDHDHVTVQAVKALNTVDVFFIPDKGSEKADLKRLRTEIVERHIAHARYRTCGFEVPRRDRSPSYRNDVAAWHAAIQEIYERLVMDELGEGECGAFLVWGDPALYDSTIRIVAALHAKGLPFDYDVIPGISSVQALAAAHRIPLNRIGEPVVIVPGRRLDDVFSKDIDGMVVVLDGDAAYRRIGGDDFEIFWGAYVGTVDERLVAGPLREVMEEIETIRQRAKAAKGWIMDSYLLRRRRSEK